MLETEPEILPPSVGFIRLGAFGPRRARDLRLAMDAVLAVFCVITVWLPVHVRLTQSDFGELRRWLSSMMQPEVKDSAGVDRAAVVFEGGTKASPCDAGTLEKLLTRQPFYQI